MDPRSKLSPALIREIHSFAQSLAIKAMLQVREMYSNQRSVKIKADRSLVTEIDVAVEKLIREQILGAFPDHGIIGEEGLEPDRQGAEFTWIIDPIDGTQSLVNRIPTFGSMLAVMFCGYPILGVIAQPMFSEVYHAAFGRGSFICKYDQQLQSTLTETRLSIEDTVLQLGDPDWKIDRNEIILSGSRRQCAVSGHAPLFDHIVRHHPYLRIYHDCFGLAIAASGRAAAMLELNVTFWDIAPCRVMVEEAGGAYHEMKPTRDQHGKTLHSGIFGKPSAVAYLAELAEVLKIQPA